MKYRQLGKTGILVSEIGFGTWGIGGLTEGATSYGKTDDEESLRALAYAFEKGITFYDTANIYGRAEELLGKAFGKRRDKVIIATKIGFEKHGGPHNVSPAHIRASLEESLKSLGSDYVDVLQFHSVPLELVRRENGCMETMADLKKEGKIRAIGYSVKDPAAALVAMNEFNVDAVQVNFNMIDQRVLTAGVLDAARERGTGIIARTPFCFGFLTGAITDTRFGVNDHRSTWPSEQLIRWKEAPAKFSLVDQESQYTPSQLALLFCIAFPEVSTVIPGMLTTGEVEENSAVSDLRPLSSKQVEAIKKICRESDFFIGKG
ncbi:MAG: aldo/keto reductase [Candidatus Jorgensenbacteria bacterium]